MDTSCARKYVPKKGWQQLHKLHDALSNCNWHFQQKVFRQTGVNVLKTYGVVMLACMGTPQKNNFLQERKT